jgi:hypothetical protein
MSLSRNNGHRKEPIHTTATHLVAATCPACATSFVYAPTPAFSPVLFGLLDHLHRVENDTHSLKRAVFDYLKLIEEDLHQCRAALEEVI